MPVRSRGSRAVSGIYVEKQPWRRERGSGGEDSLQNPAIPWGTGAVLRRIHPVFSRGFRATPCYGALHPITVARTGPWPTAAGAGGEADTRHSGPCGRRAS